MLDSSLQHFIRCGELSVAWQLYAVSQLLPALEKRVEDGEADGHSRKLSDQLVHVAEAARHQRVRDLAPTSAGTQSFRRLFKHGRRDRSHSEASSNGWRERTYQCRATQTDPNVRRRRHSERLKIVSASRLPHVFIKMSVSTWHATYAPQTSPEAASACVSQPRAARPGTAGA